MKTQRGLGGELGVNFGVRGSVLHKRGHTTSQIRDQGHLEAGHGVLLLTKEPQGHYQLSTGSNLQSIIRCAIETHWKLEKHSESADLRQGRQRVLA